MPSAYDFMAPPRIAFGWGRRRELAALALDLGDRAFLIWGSRSIADGPLGNQVLDSLRAGGLKVIESARISREPEVEDVDRAAEALRHQDVGSGDIVVAIGGGSAIDLAKAAAALATNTASRTVRDYLEGVGRGLKLTEPPIPVVALPTTAGTGSEATKNAVISCYEPPFKKSLRCDQMIPRLVIVDPEFTVGLPPAATAHSGMDAITQLIESYLSRRARPIPQAFAREGLRLAMGALNDAVHDGACRTAREAMAHAALLSGMALANSGLGFAHGIAAALGAICHVRHGLGCAVMLPVALRVNRPICETQLAELAAAIGDDSHHSASAAADKFLERIDQLCAAIGIPRRLSEIGVRREQIPALVQASQGNSMDGNPCSLSDSEIAMILEEML